MFAASANAQPKQAESVGQGSGTEIVTKPDSIPQADVALELFSRTVERLQVLIQKI